jgi:RNA polymerase-binding protein DksA
MAKTSSPKYKALERIMISEQQVLGKRIQSRFTDVFVEREPDDEVAQATYSVTRDMSAATMERERRTLAEIEAALKRIAKGSYGVCESCETAIADARLQALPWARLCITCASRGTASPAHYLQLKTAS